MRGVVKWLLLAVIFLQGLVIFIEWSGRMDILDHDAIIECENYVLDTFYRVDTLPITIRYDSVVTKFIEVPVRDTTYHVIDTLVFDTIRYPMAELQYGIMSNDKRSWIEHKMVSVRKPTVWQLGVKASNSFDGERMYGAGLRWKRYELGFLTNGDQSHVVFGAWFDLR